MGHMSTQHTQWFSHLVADDTQRAAAARSGVTNSTLSRQIARGTLSAEIVIALARAYDQSPVHALAATDYLTDAEALGGDEAAMVQTFSDQALIRELARRIDADPAAWFGTFGEVATPGAPVTDLADRRTDTPDVAGELEDVPYAADGSRTEPEEGDDDYHTGP